MEGRHLTPSRYGPAVVAYKSVRCVLAWDEPDLPAPEQRGRAVVDAITDGTTARLDQLQGLPAQAVLAVERDQQAPIADAYHDAFVSLACSLICRRRLKKAHP
jgi:hypothetical protein